MQEGKGQTPDVCAGQILPQLQKERKATKVRRPRKHQGQKVHEVSNISEGKVELKQSSEGQTPGTRVGETPDVCVVEIMPQVQEEESQISDVSVRETLPQTKQRKRFSKKSRGRKGKQLHEAVPNNSEGKAKPKQSSEGQTSDAVPSGLPDSARRER